MKVVESFLQVDLSDLKCPMIAIYDRPEDFPDKCIARVFDLDKPTDTYMIADCVWILKWDIEKYTNLYFVPRDRMDPSCIVGTYI